MGKADIFKLQRKLTFIKKQRRRTKKLYKNQNIFIPRFYIFKLVKCISWQILMKFYNIKIYRNRDDFGIFTKKNIIFKINYFIFYRYICKMYKL